MKKSIIYKTFIVVVLFMLPTFPALAQIAEHPKHLVYDTPIHIGTVEDERINESSGIARSIVNPDTFWTHNDSGDKARLFLIDSKGKTLAEVTIAGAQAIDWEDIASFKRGDNGFLLIGDFGDNEAKRKATKIYLIKEPKIGKSEDEFKIDIGPSLIIPFKYENGARNCESMAIDRHNETIYLITKERDRKCGVYELQIPKKQRRKPVTARKTATLQISKTTAMDMSPDGARAVVLTYGNAFEFVRRLNESWARAFSRRGRGITMPLRTQGESICYGSDGKTLYLTSEGNSQPFWKVPIFSEENRIQEPDNPDSPSEAGGDKGGHP